jgi:glutamate racemase
MSDGQKSSDSRPIGFFDSGLGGLTVLRRVRELHPNENWIYLGDTARLPYGTKSPDTIRRYSLANILQLQKLGVKAVVVACNSASSTLDSLHLDRLDVPVYNVIEPGAEAALAASETRRIGVLGTRATVQSKAYVRALHLRDPQVLVYQQAAPLLVPLVEEGWEDDPVTNLIIYRYVQPLIAAQIDTLIMGCTHYPALTAGLQRAVGSDIRLVDSAEAIGRQLEKDFHSLRLKPSASTPAQLRLFATDASPQMDSTAQRLMKDANLPSFEGIDIELVSAQHDLLKGAK